MLNIPPPTVSPRAAIDETVLVSRTDPVPVAFNGLVSVNAADSWKLMGFLFNRVLAFFVIRSRGFIFTFGPPGLPPV